MKCEFIEVTPRTGLVIGSSMFVAGLLFVVWKFHRISEELRSMAFSYWGCRKFEILHIGK